MNYKTYNEVRESLKAGTALSGVMAMTVSQKAIDKEARTVDWIISTADVDRHGDTVAVDGWDLKNYKKNPVVLFAHDHNSLPVGRANSIEIQGGKLAAQAQFPTKDEYAFADTVFQLVLGRYLNATSVGFLPTKWQYVETNDRPWGIDFLEQELLEFSVVPIPANPNALLIARSKGIDVAPMAEWASQLLDNFDKNDKGLFIPKGQLETVYKLTKLPTAQVFDGGKLKGIVLIKQDGSVDLTDMAKEETTDDGSDGQQQDAGAGSAPADDGAAAAGAAESPAAEGDSSTGDNGDSADKSGDEVGKRLDQLESLIKDLSKAVGELSTSNSGLPQPAAKGSLAEQSGGGQMVRVTVPVKNDQGADQPSTPRIRINAEDLSKRINSQLAAAVEEGLGKAMGKLP